MLTILQGGKENQQELSEKLTALAAKCDSEGNLPPEHTGELFRLMLEVLEYTRESKQDIERLGKRLNEAEVKLTELASMNETAELLIDYIEMFLDEKGLKDIFTAYLDGKLNEKPSNAIRLS
ncbi:hypothetical protein KL86SPO_50218 [uncultured Sporomusa sp.]|uniref:Uncharacterized protein n=1 Tax=uncultured Sporomusa sp. TaxID=307249 RepID=A0A212LYC4_9FIRM|nr:hypothetical protein [uncultured Sporomusa sp.]SCM82447.1 hypothetical protein KL86SPO_50218 [uncultured Sporomusa sp.]